MSLYRHVTGVVYLEKIDVREQNSSRNEDFLSSASTR
jgi:hypothetical protein